MKDANKLLKKFMSAYFVSKIGFVKLFYEIYHRIKMNKAYISLGSNKDDRLGNIQSAVVRIQKDIGVLIDLSSIYETLSWGFDGPDFLNACIGIETELQPLQVLNNLLKIEQQMGRVRSPEGVYKSRNIDLDLLFYENQIIEVEGLNLPHPCLELRNFILFPMCELAPDFLHPQLGKSMVDLSKICPDSSSPEKKPLKKWSPDLFIEDQILVFEGNIGVGKTSLAKKIAKDYNVPALLENFTQNPYLEKFYDQPERFALPLENYFLADRYHQFSGFFKGEIPKKIGVTDHSLFKSLIFAKINLSFLDYKDFKKNYDQWVGKEFVFQKVIFLHQPLERIKQQIKSRGRSYEQNISPDYLKKIEVGYQNFIQLGLPFRYQKIDLTDLDFVNDERAYQIILQRIKAF